MSALFECVGVARRYPVTGSRPWRVGVRTALEGVDLRVPADRDLALIGESGSGKSTLLRLLLGLERPDAGVVRFRGTPVNPWRARPLRRAIGVVGQDAGGSLDPRCSVGTSIREPLECLDRSGSRAAHDARVAELLATVELDADLAARRPAGLSGGERQRVALARALAAGPEVLVADEPFSAVDPAVRARLVALVARTARAEDMRLVVVTHDLGMAERLADDVAVLAAGRLVEHGPVTEVFARPRAEATRALLDAVPRLPEVPA